MIPIPIAQYNSGPRKSANKNNLTLPETIGTIIHFASSQQ